MFNRHAYENAGPDGIGVLEIVTGPEKPDDRPRRFVPLRRTELKGEVVGPLAALRLTQLYSYSAEECDQVLEAAYRFPLPGDAAVTGVVVRFGTVEMRTELKERAAAESEYEAAKEEGRQAALMSRESPDVFTLRLAGLQPGQPITVETSYVQQARAEGTGWSLRIPLTTSPRYVRGDELTSRHAQGQPLALLRDPGHRFSLDLQLAEVGTVRSPTHPLSLTEEGDRVRVRLQEGEVVPDRDCVLTWQPRQERDRSSFHVWLHEDRTAEQLYFLALLAPPATPVPGHGISREVILLVDHSGSMHGAKWEATDWAARKFLSELTERDRFNLGLFHNTTRWFAKQPRLAASGTVEEAVRFLQEYRDSGGTELGVALEQALGQARSEGDLARHILVVTDAEVSDAGRILRLADQEAVRPDKRRVSVLCIDAAPNSFLALELAERGGGIARFLTSNPEQEDITTALDEVLADWSQPVLADLQLEVNRPEARVAGSRNLDGDGAHGRVDLGDLATGRSLWRSGCVPRGSDPELTLRVLDRSGREVKTRRLSLGSPEQNRPEIKALFGAWQLLGLELLIHQGYAGAELEERLRRLGFDPAAMASKTNPKVYAENARAESENALRKLLVETSLDTGLICSETAFVATRTEAGKRVEGTVVVANALPAGWSEEFAFAAPGGVKVRRMSMLATSAPAFAMPQRRVGSIQASLMNQVPAMAEPPPSTPVEAPTHVLFTGTPRFEGGEAVLFDSTGAEDGGKLPDTAIFSRLTVRFPGGAPDARSLDRELSLQIYIDDLSQPRAAVRLADLIRQGGERPLNFKRLPGQRLRIVLADLAGAWSQNAPLLEVALG